MRRQLGIVFRMQTSRSEDASVEGRSDSACPTTNLEPLHCHFLGDGRLLLRPPAIGRLK